MELTLDQALQKGVEAHKAGKAQEADGYYTAILKAQPKHPDANHNMGVLAVGLSKVEAALPFFKTALETNPKIAQYWLSYIDALVKLDRMSEAKAIFDQAKGLGLNDNAFDQIEKRFNSSASETSNVQEPPKDQLQPLVDLYTKGQYQQALNEAAKLLIEFPESINLHNIAGAANQGLGRLDEALASYKKAISLKPDFAIAHNNMGNTLKNQGKLDEAIEAYNKALSIKPDYAEAYYNFGNALQSAIFKKPNRDLQYKVAAILDKKSYATPSRIAKATISLLKFESGLKKQLQLSDEERIQSPLDAISDLIGLPLLLKLMRVCPVPDLEIEGLLKNLRCSILESIGSISKASSELLSFQSTLALQCFTNEYIYSHTESEEKLLQVLDASVKKDLESNKQPKPQSVLALASYRALNQYEWHHLLHVTDHIQEVFTRQVEEPQKEINLKSTIPTINKITDGVSSKVREQYEENPYPRWVNLGMRLEPVSIQKIVNEIQLKLQSHKINEVEKPDILIAGCGTGQHSIGTASRFKYSQVLAIDLSLSSLAYAKRKTNEFGIENIEYMQADILDLGHLNKQFDIIESAGVLHHMENPMAGWKVLTDCLKPGGLMRIGLYSELARQSIIKIRDEINQLDIGSSSTEMKSFRDMIIKSEEDHHKLIVNSPDFYSLSDLRDLLFHVQEHRFTIPLIKDHLDELGLKFCGFEANEIISKFSKNNIYPDDPYDLDKWQSYEEENPRTFAGMYQFWCQKADLN